MRVAGGIMAIARQSISDWKNIYLDACRDCALQAECGGFFHSAGIAHSRGIRPFLPASAIPIPLSS